MKTVNSVLGPIATTALGVTLMHEHVQGSLGGIPQIYPELLGDNYEERVLEGLVSAKRGGVDTVVDCTTMDIGRDVRLLAEASRRSGINIIASTGWNVSVVPYLGAHSADQFARIFAREIEEGIEGTGIKAGILKGAADFAGVTPQLEPILRGVARAQLKTGAPVMLHSYAPGQVARRQLAVLAEEGVDLRRVKVDHLLDTTDLEYIAWVAEQGCYLGVDRMPGMYFCPPTSPAARIRTLKALIDAGYTDRLLISHDTVLISSFYDTLPEEARTTIKTKNPHGLLYIHKVVLPKLREMGVSEETINGILIDNPRRFFEGN